MPRTVDHDARRASLADAVWRLVARGGVEAVSLRSVAAEAGVSMGRVQYYFPTKDDLLLYGLQHAHRRMEQRIEARLEQTGGAEREVLVAILDELLGEHPETRDAIRVHAAFAAREVDGPTAAVLTDGDDEILALCVAVVAQARATGRTGADIDPELDGYALWTLARGLGSDVALYGAPVARARATLTRFLDRVAPPAP
ncbi:MAG: TetR family transcriptional regulator [Streptosporangiales bacterium]|nr:TetR family transcriptional regulator [Streptosporangiales bacterium]